jgi:hypothetical protein
MMVLHKFGKHFKHEIWNLKFQLKGLEKEKTDYDYGG